MIQRREFQLALEPSFQEHRIPFSYTQVSFSGGTLQNSTLIRGTKHARHVRQVEKRHRCESKLVRQEEAGTKLHNATGFLRVSDRLDHLAPPGGNGRNQPHSYHPFDRCDL
ncbi:hypothetical protein E2C01_069659 [Portunus trituberculatus]|uniref:Uncharacterized protein n=1 Tax=Portunus trituberculatus TaxID=210409 RepID=A0A5B7I3E3_PORTR|nr:hypothetical protein [Portunus trituberculatus]